MAELRTKSGIAILIDDEDVATLSKYSWYINNYGYPCSRSNGGKLTVISRLLTNCPSDMDVDHANGNPLDNRKENLRICTVTQNLGNARRRSDNGSGYKGVGWQRSRNAWRARCRGKHLGLFSNPEAAARAYDREAVAQFGSFARLNFGF